MSVLSGDTTWADWVRLIAARHGIHDLTDEQAGVLLWERTAFPFSTDPDYLLPQVEAALTGVDLCPCCGGPFTDVTCGVCGDCARRHDWKPADRMYGE